MRTPVILMFVFVSIGMTSTAFGQSYDWLVLPVATNDDAAWAGSTVGIINQRLAELRIGAWAPDHAATRFEQRGSAPSTEVTDTDLEEWVALSRGAIRHLARGEYSIALQELERAQVLSRKAANELNRERALARNLLDTCLYMVRALLETGDRARAKTQVQECVRLVPRGEPNAHMHKPDVIRLYEEAGGPGPEQTGSLRVESKPSGCDVRINGLRLGRTPFQVTDLYSGTYHVQVECDPSERGRVHPTEVRRGRASVFVDTRFDRALRTGPLLMLSYPERPDHRALVGDAQELAGLLPAGAVVLAMMGGVDTMELRVVSGTERHGGRAHVATTTTGPSTTDVSMAVEALINGECKDFTGPKPVEIDCKTGMVRVEVRTDGPPHSTSDHSRSRWVSPGGYLPGRQ